MTELLSLKNRLILLRMDTYSMVGITEKRNGILMILLQGI